MNDSLSATLLLGDARERLHSVPPSSVQTCVTSPPYFGMRDYGFDDQIGGEARLEDYISNLVEVFRGVRRVLRDDGTVWLNLGDSFTSGGRKYRAPDQKLPQRGMAWRPPTPDGLKPKDLIGVPWRVALALQQDGWYLRSDIIWHKPNALPESVTDRPTRSHEYIFLLTKNPRYFYDQAAAPEQGRGGHARRRRTVWSVNTVPFKGAHFATFPPSLIEPCILHGSRVGDTVLDPFNGAGTTGLVALGLGRRYVGIEKNPDYLDLTAARLSGLADLSLIKE